MKIELLLLLSPFVPIGLLFIAILLYDKSCKKKIDIITSLFLQLEARIDKLEAEISEVLKALPAEDFGVEAESVTTKNKE